MKRFPVSVTNPTFLNFFSKLPQKNYGPATELKARKTFQANIGSWNSIVLKYTCHKNTMNFISVQKIRLPNLVLPYAIQSKNSRGLTLPVITNGCGVHVNVLLITHYQCPRFVNDLQVICSNMDLFIS